VLVREQHLVDEPVSQQTIVGVGELDLGEDLECPLPDLGHVRAKLVAAKNRELVADLARVFDRVVESTELAAHRLAAADPLDEPKLLEVGDVAEVPGERAQDRRVDPVELVVGERLDQEKRPLPGLGQAFGDRIGEVGLRCRRDL
jgi:hypothetical protein